MRVSVEQRAHCFLFVETIGASTDMRSQQGLQVAPTYPAIGFVLAPEEAGAVPGPLRVLPESALNMEAQPLDGVWYECELEPNMAYVVVPYLGEQHGGQAPDGLQLAVTVYTDVPHTLGQGAVEPPPPPPKVEEAWECEICAAAFPRRTCPWHMVHSRMCSIERIMDSRLAFLDQVIATTGAR